MYLYVVLVVIASIIAGVIIAGRTKKAERVVYDKLDKVGRITNIVLIPVYAVSGLFCMVIAALFAPNYDGFWGVVGWIVSVIGATGPALCALGLGASVALRKRGKSKLGFLAQFAGVGGLGLTLLIFFLFYGNLLDTLN